MSGTMSGTMRSTASWRELTRIEPRLRMLHSQIKGIKDDRTRQSFCANAVWYGYGGHIGFKERLLRLVGFYSSNPDLRTMEAYDLACDKLYKALPDCRNCGCM